MIPKADRIHILMFTSMGKTRNFVLSIRKIKWLCSFVLFGCVSLLALCCWFYHVSSKYHSLQEEMVTLRQAIFSEYMALANHQPDTLLEAPHEPYVLVAPQPQDFTEWAFIQPGALELQDVQVTHLRMEEDEKEWHCYVEVRNLQPTMKQEGVIDALAWYENAHQKIQTSPTYPQSSSIKSGKIYGFQNFASYHLKGRKIPDSRLVRLRLVLKDKKGRQMVLDPFASHHMV